MSINDLCSQSHAALTERQNTDKNQLTSIYFKMGLSKEVREGEGEGNTL